MCKYGWLQGCVYVICDISPVIPSFDQKSSQPMRYSRARGGVYNGGGEGDTPSPTAFGGIYQGKQLS